MYLGNTSQYRIVPVEKSSCIKVIGHTRSFVTFKHLDEETIVRYVQSKESFDKAGSYAIQGLGSTLVEKIEGDFYGVVGLSPSLLSEMLKLFDIKIP